MRTTHRNSSTTGVTRRAPVISTLAAVCMAVPLSGLLGGAALAAEDAAALKVDRGGNSEAAKAAAAEKKDDLAPAVKTAENKPAEFVGPVVPAKKAEEPAPAAKSEPASAPAAAKSGPNSNTTSTPYSNQGGITTGSNTTKYEVVNGRDGSPAKGGGQPSGDVQSPQPYSKADKNNTGANDPSATNQYRSTRDGAPSLNGNGGGKQVGQPCAGCVGKADNKNPPGQAPNGTDRNAGYECDRNHGIGRSNPAHTGCRTGTTTNPTLGATAGCFSVTGTATGQSLTSVVVTFVDGSTQTLPASGTSFSKSDFTKVVKSVVVYAGTNSTTASAPKNCGSTGSDNIDAKAYCDYVKASSNKALTSVVVTFADGSTQSFSPNALSFTSATFTKVVKSVSATSAAGTASDTVTKKCDKDEVCVPKTGEDKDCKPVDEEKKITICHSTSSETNPFVVITISTNGLNGHEDHANDVIPAYTFKGVSYPGKNLGKPCGTTDKKYDCKGHELPNNHTAAECVQDKLYDCKGHELPNNHGTAECETGKTYDCKGHELPNNHTAAECTQDVQYDCKGHQLPNDHTAAECNPPVVTVCPAGTMQTPQGCITTGNTGGPAQGPGTIRPNAPTITPIGGPTGGPAAGPTALPFTGTDALLLAQLSALMLLVGGGLVGLSRKRKVLATR